MKQECKTLLGVHIDAMVSRSAKSATWCSDRMLLSGNRVYRLFRDHVRVRGHVRVADRVVDRGMFWSRTDEGFSTVGMVLALLITLALIFTCAQVYEINTTSAEVQEVADAAVLAAENTVGEFYIVVAVCDAVLFTLSLTMLISLGIGIVCACVPPAAGASKVFMDAAKKLSKTRDSFYKSAQESLEKLQKALPFLAAAKAQQVLSANSDQGSSFKGVAVLCPWEAEQTTTLTFEKSDTVLQAGESEHETLLDQAQQAEEAAKEANASKQHAYEHDSGSKDAYCMYERASTLAGMSGADNPFFSSVDTWNFSAALARAQTYYSHRLQQETPEGSSVEEQSNSVLRSVFYAYAVDEIGKGYVVETDDSFEAYFPILPQNTTDMMGTSLYTDVRYLRTQNAEGKMVLHAWNGCPGCRGVTSAGLGAIQDMDNNPAYAICPYCKFAPSSLGKVAAASSHIENGFEYHYNEVARAAADYQKARATLDPLTQEIKSTATDLFDQIGEALQEALSQRIDVIPPGHWGAIALVVGSGSEPNFLTSFVQGSGAGDLGSRVALSCATLVRESSDEGKTVLTSFLDGVKNAGGVGVGAMQVVLDVWSGLLGAYTTGHDALSNTLKQALNNVPLAGASGLGTWAADTFEEGVRKFGFDPPDLAARKAVLVNSSHVLQADSSSFSAYLYDAKQGVVEAGSSGSISSIGALRALAADTVELLDQEFEIATVVLFDGAVEIPITITLPAAVTEGVGSALQQGIDALSGITGSWTGVRQWE